MVIQHHAQFDFDGLLCVEGIERVEEFLQRGELAEPDFTAGLESLERCGWSVVVVLFVAAAHLAEQMLHHRAEVVTQSGPLVAVKVMQQSGSSRAFGPRSAPRRPPSPAIARLPPSTFALLSAQSTDLVQNLAATSSAALPVAFADPRQSLLLNLLSHF